VKDDSVHLDHILECLEHIEEYTAGGRGAFFASRMIQDAVVRKLQILAESSQRVSDPVKASQPDIPWKELSGFRNVLTHGYLGLDLELVWRAVEENVPSLKSACRAARAALGSRA